MNKFSTAKICRAGIIAGLYFVLTYFLQAISFGPVQLRVSEAFTILPLFFPEAVPALFIGCFLSNTISGFGPYDMILGSLATLLASILTAYIGKLIKNKTLKFILGAIPPIVINAIVIPFVIYLSGGLEYTYFIQALLLFVGQALAIYPFGGLLYFSIDRIKAKNPSLF